MFAGVLSAAAQQDTVRTQAPDNDAILRETINSASPYYYPTLFTRYLTGDTTLTDTDYRYLYYGFVWRPEYKPFGDAGGPRQDPANSGGRFAERGGLPAGYRLRERGVEKEPFDPGAINFLIYAYGGIGDTLNERINYYRLQGVLNAIKSSGTGLSEESPWHIIYFSHVRDFLASENIICGKERVISRTVAYTPLLVKEKGVKGYYFDFGRIYWQRPDKEPSAVADGNSTDCR